MDTRSRRARRSAGAGKRLGLLLLVAGCTAPPVAPICTLPPGAAPDEVRAAACACQHATGELDFVPYRRPQLDVLFVIGNTPGMARKQRALAESFAFLATMWRSRNIDYHIGVVSTDVGTWTAPGTPFQTSAGACDSFSGDDGRLQSVSCLDRVGVSSEAARACAELCPDRRFAPSDGRPFLVNYRGDTNVPQSLELDARFGQLIDRGPEHALRCMLLLGDGGCEVSSPLESARRALSGPQARGFLRDEAPLLLILLTDRDDCSVSLARRADNDPQTLDCPAPDADAPARCFSPGAYRCLARSLTCREPMNTAGPKTGCRERAGSSLEEVESYVRFFNTLRPREQRGVIGLVPLPSIEDGGPINVAQSQTVAGTPGLEIAGGAEAGCQAPEDPTVTGQPQLRMSRFLTALLGGKADPWGYPVRTSACDLVRYAGEANQLGFLRSNWPGPPCLPGLPALRPDSTPDCVVSFVPEASPYSTSTATLPACAARCCDAFAQSPIGYGSTDPALATACADEPADCYCAGPSRTGQCSGTAVLGVWYKDNADPPPNTAVSARCAFACPVR